MKVIEFCSGYGGATAGMLAAGLEMEHCYDIWPIAVKAHQEWHPEVPCSVRDVAGIEREELRGKLVWASLPCQPWSDANRVAAVRGKKHPHYYSLAHFARQVQHARCALIENVPGLLWSAEGRVELLELERECARLGLGMSVHLVFSHWFGVLQARRRAFIVIGRDFPLLLIQQSIVTRVDVNGLEVRRPHASVLANRDQGRSRFESAVMASEGKGRGGDFTTASKGRSIERCAELQGVPVPNVGKTDAYTLIGNAVPPLLAESIARQVFVPLGGPHE